MARSNEIGVPVLIAIVDPAREAELVRDLGAAAGVAVVRRCVDLADLLAGAAAGVAVVRRCVDLADLLAAAAAGLAQVAILSADLRRLDREAVARLAAS